MDPNQNQIDNVSQIPDKPQSISYVSSRSQILKRIKIIAIVLIIIGTLSTALIFAVNYLREPEIKTLTYWGTWEEAQVIQPIIDEFEKANPKVKIKYEKQDIKGLGKHVERLKTRIDKGTGPDIYSFHSSWTLQMKNYLRPFPKEVVASTQIETDFYKTVQRDVSLNGAYYGVPLYVDTLALFVNSQMIDNIGLQPPREWFDLTRVYVPNLTVRNGDEITTSAIALGGYDNINHASDIIAMLLLQNGADVNKLAGSRKSNTEIAFAFYSSFLNGENRTWNNNFENSRDAFAKGKLAMYFGYTRDISEIKAINPNLVFKVVEAPSLVEVKSPVASYWVEGVSAKTKHPDIAFSFLEYLSRPESLQKIKSAQERIRQVGYAFPRKSMQSQIEDDETLKVMTLQADNARTTFFSSDTYDGDSGMITQMDKSLGNAIKSLSGGSIEDAVDTLGSETSRIISSYE